MTRIDLIPPELVEKHKAKRIMSYIAMGSGVIFVVLIIVYLATLGQVILASSRVKQIKAEDQRVQAYVTNLKPYNARKTVLDDRTKIVQTILTSQVLWSGVLNDISMVVPNDVWLKTVKMDITQYVNPKSGTGKTAADTPPITITGDAADHAAVARWLVHLGEINSFRSVWLDYATEQQITTGSVTTPGATGNGGTMKVIEFQTTVKLAQFSK
jgi:Tfp pilus assembly protein PilN